MKRYVNKLEDTDRDRDISARRKANRLDKNG